MDTRSSALVDAGVDALVSRLGTALKAPSPDMKLVDGVIQQIGGESCGKCHLVHIPAAYAKASWKEWEKSPR